MENHFIRRFPRLFPSSFTSCHFRHVPDTVESSIAITKSTQNLQPDEDLPFSRIQTHSSLNEPQKPKNPKNDSNASKNRKTLIFGSDTDGKKCPPVTPVSTLNLEQKERAKVLKIKNSSSSNSVWFSSEENEVDGETETFISLSSVSSASFRLKTGETFQEKLENMSTAVGRCPSEVSVRSTGTIISQLSQSTPKRFRKTTKKGHGNTKPGQQTTKTCRRNDMIHGEFVKESEVQEGFEVPGIPGELYHNDYYGSCRRKTTKTGRNTRNNRRRSRVLTSEVGWCSIVFDGRVEESYAVEKSSSDPYSDFRISMVEMIVEKQIFGDEDLKRLLRCFLSLNSPCYHEVIVEVFSEICETLFNN